MMEVGEDVGTQVHRVVWPESQNAHGGLRREFLLVMGNAPCGDFPPRSGAKTGRPDPEYEAFCVPAGDELNGFTRRH